MKERREKHTIYAALGASMLASLVWLIAVGTDGWVELILPKSAVYLASLHHDAGGQVALVEQMWTGLWKLCRVEYVNVTDTADDVTSLTVTQKKCMYTGPRDVICTLYTSAVLLYSALF